MSEDGSKFKIDKLKEKFKDYPVITVSDFIIFYSSINEEISKSTVRNYIHELKEKNLIRNISRGQYILVDNNFKNIEDYVVITMDIIKSSDINYIVFNKNLKNIINELNEKLLEVFNYDRKYYVSQGDEIQILLPFDKNLGKMLMLALSYLYPMKVRYAISLGNISEDLKSNSWEMNGPIFWNARDHLEKLKTEKDYSGLVASGFVETDNMCNKILKLTHINISRITHKQWDAIKLNICGLNDEKSFNKNNMSKTSYYDRLKTSNFEDIIMSFDVIYEILKKREVIK